MKVEDGSLSSGNTMIMRLIIITLKSSPTLLCGLVFGNYRAKRYL